MSTTWTPTVAAVIDGQQVKAGTLNPILGQLVKRDQYLYEQFSSVADKSVIIAYSLPADPTVVIGDIVFFDPSVGLLKKAQKGFTSSGNNPINDSFVLGIVKSVDTTQGSHADVYVKGLIEVSGILASLDVSSTSPSSPASSPLTTGPLYLSKMYPGKASNNPGGLCVYIGYALSANQVLLDPRNESINQLFFNYKFDLLDRPIGTPAIDANGNYQVNNADTAKTGWIDINNAALPTSISSTFPKYLIPTTAVYYYWIPPGSQITEDTTITAEEQNTALALVNSFPPYPYSFTYLTVNGVNQSMWSPSNQTGRFYVNSAGLWWIGGTPGEQPWANDLSLSWIPSQWATVKGSDYLRPKINMQFVKMNPDYQLTTVTALSSTTPCLIVKDGKNPSALTGVATGTKLTGDVALQLNLTSATATSLDTTGTFVRGISVDTSTGTLTALTSPGISSLIAGAGVAVNQLDSDPSQWVISASSTGISGVVEDIEPENARLENKGLHWYITLTDPTTFPSGFVGKFLIPRNTPKQDIQLYLNLFTSETGASGKTLGLAVEYAVSAPGTIIDDTVFPLDAISIPFGGSYVTSKAFTSPAIVIPSSVLTGVTDNAYLNFRVTRIPSGDFTGDVGVIGVSWKIT